MGHFLEEGDCNFIGMQGFTENVTFDQGPTEGGE